jgi:hypothetical protein
MAAKKAEGLFHIIDVISPYGILAIGHAEKNTRGDDHSSDSSIKLLKRCRDSTTARRLMQEKKSS